jgi:HAE1 family hydrophobic/amphiphilic exporter-1
MAVTVIGGLLTSTLLTLVLIPAVYTIMDDFTGLLSGAPRFVRLLLGWRPARQRPVPQPVPPRTPELVPAPAGSSAD